MAILDYHRALCETCGKAIPEDKKYCSPECEKATQRQEKLTKRTTRLYYLIFAVTMILVAIFLLTMWRGS
mgnify:CR=1 FL=1